VKSTRHPSSARPASARVVAGLRARLANAEETLRGIRNGDVDTLVIATPAGPQIFTLQGAEHGYRMLIESMNEGALTLAADKTILYANQCFARMVHSPLEHVVGGSLHRFLSVADRTVLGPLLRRTRRGGAKTQMLLKAADGSHLPVQVSIRALAQDGFDRAVIGMVVTDLSASRHSEEMLQALSRRLVEAQEFERGRLARELHDNITQLLCATLVRCQTLADQLPPEAKRARAEAFRIRDLLGQAVNEVERISRDQHSGVLEHLGLIAVLRDTSQEFARRTGVPIDLACVKLTTRLSPDIELTLYRILQEALKNIEQHARARHVVVRLTKPCGFVQLAIIDNGVGLHPESPTSRRHCPDGLGLLGMRERAQYVGGVLQVKSGPRVGTEIKIRIPLPAVKTSTH